MINGLYRLLSKRTKIYFITFNCAGAKVVIASRSSEKLESAALEFAKVGSGQITPITCNIRKEDEVKYLNNPIS
jgi:NADP-dependent 3-hydroxy acid dehydrogenase YdfG